MLVSAVDIHVEGGAPVAATLTIVPDQPVPTVRFVGLVDVPEQAGVHTVTAVVTDDDLQHGTAAVQVLRDVTVVVPAPAILIDLEPPVPTSPDDPSVQSLVTTVQKALADRAAVLAASGIVVAGPNVLAAQDATGVPILRLGIWLVDAAFPVEPAAPPDFPLPRLSPVQAEAGFGPAPALRRGHRVGGTDTPFGLRIPVTTHCAKLSTVFRAS